MATSTKPHKNLWTLGHVGHGKTTFTAAIAKAVADIRLINPAAFYEIDRAPEAGVEYETDECKTTIVDFPTHADIVKNMITGIVQIDGGILVVSAPDGLMPQTREHVRLARLVGVPSLLCFLTKVDAVDDPELLDCVDMEHRELLNSYGFLRYEFPIIRGSALSALQGEYDTIGRDAMGGVTVLTGRVERGTIKVGEDVEILGLMQGDPLKTTVTGVEMFKNTDQAQTVELVIRGLKSGDVQSGQVVAKPGTVKMFTRFEAEIFVLTQDEGGRLPGSVSYVSRPMFYMRNVCITGMLKLPESVEIAMPSDNVTAVFELSSPVPLEAGQRFDVRERGRTVGVGVVSKVIS